MAKDTEKRLLKTLEFLKEPHGSTIPTIVKAMKDETPQMSLKKIVQTLKGCLDSGIIKVTDGRVKLRSSTPPGIPANSKKKNSKPCSKPCSIETIVGSTNSFGNTPAAFKTCDPEENGNGEDGGNGDFNGKNSDKTERGSKECKPKPKCPQPKSKCPQPRSKCQPCKPRCKPKARSKCPRPKPRCKPKRKPRCKPSRPKRCAPRRKPKIQPYCKKKGCPI